MSGSFNVSNVAVVQNYLYLNHINDSYCESDPETNSSIILAGKHPG